MSLIYFVFFKKVVNLYDLFPWTTFTTSRFILLRKLKIKKKIERDRIKPDVKDKKKKVRNSKPLNSSYLTSNRLGSFIKKSK